MDLRFYTLLMVHHGNARHRECLLNPGIKVSEYVSVFWRFFYNKWIDSPSGVDDTCKPLTLVRIPAGYLQTPDTG